MKQKTNPFPISNTHFADLLEKFNDYCMNKGYRPSYAYQQFKCVQEFLHKMEITQELETLQEVKSDHIKRHYKYLSTRKHQRRSGSLSASMLYHHIQAIKNFFKWLQADQVIEQNPMSVLRFTKGQTKAKKGLDYEIIQELYEATITLREKVILHGFYACGLRNNEATSLNVNDINFEKKALYVRSGKGRKRRVVPLQESVATDLQNYILYERQAYIRKTSAPNEKALILGHAGGRLTGHRANTILKELAKRLASETQKQIGNIYPHKLRRSIAHHLKANGMLIETLADFLGHESIDATQIYLGSPGLLKQKYKLNKKANAREYKKH